MVDLFEKDSEDWPLTKDNEFWSGMVVGYQSTFMGRKYSLNYVISAFLRKKTLYVVDLHLNRTDET